MDNSEHCDQTILGVHVYNPRLLSKPGQPVVEEYRCLCGKMAPSRDSVLAALDATKAERKRQKQLARRFKLKRDSGVQQRFAL